MDAGSGRVLLPPGDGRDPPLAGFSGLERSLSVVLGTLHEAMHSGRSSTPLGFCKVRITLQMNWKLEY